jgi:hypothetical protein
MKEMRLLEEQKDRARKGARTAQADAIRRAGVQQAIPVGAGEAEQ